ncbi:hypothetical protein K469DRAFT_691940 [Zopfia rhizophila CBS 207.26]|uniref:Uncharacterized protein n=1 Tax=Zopfia rhizophila CBS 207.26 TaxID=1314779 RepID=A0A6A6DQK9_9PEZI|nr:hypothetical protein K469DRAFT_691940 [Zopfia rhizophila CBS 207.26]
MEKLSPDNTSCSREGDKQSYIRSMLWIVLDEPWIMEIRNEEFRSLMKNFVPPLGQHEDEAQTESYFLESAPILPEIHLPIRSRATGRDRFPTTDMPIFLRQLSSLIEEGEETRIHLWLLSVFGSRSWVFDTQIFAMHNSKPSSSSSKKRIIYWNFQLAAGWGRHLLDRWEIRFGKSTLCKFLIANHRTRAILGLRRTTTFEPLWACPELIPNVFSHRSEYAQYLGRDEEVWIQRELLSRKKEIFNHRVSAGFRIFINGFDEYVGDHGDVDQLLQGLIVSSDIKLCLFSRPWNVFRDAFGHYRSMVLPL